MVYTEKYCVTCRRRLSRKDRSPEATAFLNDCRSTEGNTARYKDVITEENGVCFACGKRDYCDVLRAVTSPAHQRLEVR